MIWIHARQEPKVAPRQIGHDCLIEAPKPPSSPKRGCKVAPQGPKNLALICTERCRVQRVGIEYFCEMEELSCKIIRQFGLLRLGQRKGLENVLDKLGGPPFKGRKAQVRSREAFPFSSLPTGRSEQRRKSQQCFGGIWKRGHNFKEISGLMKRPGHKNPAV